DRRPRRALDQPVQPGAHRAQTRPRRGGEGAAARGARARHRPRLQGGDRPLPAGRRGARRPARSGVGRARLRRLARALRGDRRIACGRRGGGQSRPAPAAGRRAGRGPVRRSARGGPGRLPRRDRRSGARRLEAGSDLALQRGDRLLVALVEGPAGLPLRGDEAGAGERLQMGGRGRLGDLQLLGDEDDADAVLDEVAVALRREMRARVIQPLEDLEPLRARERCERCGVEHQPIRYWPRATTTAEPPTSARSSEYARARSRDGRPISSPWRISTSVPHWTAPWRPRWTASGPAADPVAGSSATPSVGPNQRLFHRTPEPAKQYAPTRSCSASAAWSGRRAATASSSGRQTKTWRGPFS